MFLARVIKKRNIFASNIRKLFVCRNKASKKLRSSIGIFSCSLNISRDYSSGSEWRSFSCGKWVEIKPSVGRNRNQTSFATSDLICYNYQSIWMSSERKSDAIKNKLNWNFRKTNVIYRRLAVLAYIKIVNKTSAPLNVNSKRLCSVSRRTKFTQRSRKELHFSSSRGNFVGEILRWEKNSSRASKTSNSTKNLMHLNG